MPSGEGPFDIVLANLIASLLVKLAVPLRDEMVPGGRILASGIFRDREGDVVAAFQAAGLQMGRRWAEEAWVALEAIAPAGETDVAETLHVLANRFKRRGLIVLVSDLCDEPEEVVRALNHFRHRRHEVIVFHVLDKAEIEFPFRETIAFHDLETDERIQIEPAYVRDDYVARIEAFIAGYRRACAEAQIDYVLADTSVPYDFMLSKYLAKRSRG